MMVYYLNILHVRLCMAYVTKQRAAQSIAQSGGDATVTVAAAGDSLLSLIYRVMSITQISVQHDLAATSIGSGQAVAATRNAAQTAGRGQPSMVSMLQATGTPILRCADLEGSASSFS